MVISGVNTVTYSGDGINKAWPYTYPVTDEDEIKIQLNNADGTAVNITSDYYVDMVNSTVYYPGYAPGSEPPEADQPPKVQPGQKITVYRDIPITQEADLGEAWPFSVIEFGLDKLTMICQQIYSYTNRKLDDALASMFQLSDIMVDSGKLQEFTDTVNTINVKVDTATTAATNAATSATNAAASALSASTSASNASTSATNASTSATSAAASASSVAATAETLTDIYNDAIDQGTITAPAVDPTLSIVGAAADAKVTGVDINLINDTEDGVLRNMTNGHLWRIRPLGWSDMVRYQEVGGIISEKSAVKGSDYMLCPKNLCVHFSDVNARCYLYFYTLSGGVYTPVWDEDILKFVASDNTLNYVHNSSEGGLPKQIIRNIPDGTYFRFREVVGTVELYGWDGELFDGMPIAGDAGYPSTDGTIVETLRSSGGFGITIPGNTKFLLTDGEYLVNAVSYIDGNNTYGNIDSLNRGFRKLPDGYKIFRCRVPSANDAGDMTVTRTGDVNNHVIAVGNANTTELPYGRAEEIRKTAKSICDVEWVAQNSNVYVSKKYRADDGTDFKADERKNFKTGITYNGFPYAESWREPHFLGWHYSLHTILNAMNDGDSIFYEETADHETTEEDPITHEPTRIIEKTPYMGFVCSSFATLVTGWPYPQTNKGFAYDPKVMYRFSATPVIGEIYSSGSHCTVPVENTTYSNGDKSSTLYSGTTPVCTKAVRRDKLTRPLDKSAYKKAYGTKTNGRSWFDGYGYVAHHIEAKANLELVPYEVADTTIVGGNARPYKGDKCVYTSEEEHVYINIKNSAATLYLRKGLYGEVMTIATGGADRVDVKPHLNGAGIYYVYAINTTEESFEFVIPGHVTITLDANGKIVSTEGDYWYMVTLMYGNDIYPGTPPTNGSQCCIPMLDDYSGWNRGNQYVQAVRAVFGKGEYGAYNIPFDSATIDDGSDDDEEPDDGDVVD